MKEQLKALSKETAIYGVSTVVGRFLNFLLVPFYVNVLSSTAEYGISTTLYTYISFLNVIYPLGLEAAYFRYAAKGEREGRTSEEEIRLFSTPFNVLLLFGAALSLLIYLLAPALVRPVFADPHMDITPYVPTLTSILRYSALILLFDSLAIIPFATLRLEHRAKYFALVKFFNIVLTLALNFYMILSLKMGVQGIFLANLVASGVVLLMLVPVFKERARFLIDKMTLRTMLPFGLTNVPAYLSSMMVQVINRPIVQMYLGLGALGVFQANYRMGFMMMVFVSLFEYAWRPFFLKQSRTDDARARLIFSRVFTYFMLFTLTAFLLLSFFLPYILTTPIFGRQLLTPQYQGGINIIPIVLLAFVFQGMYTNFIAGIYIKERNRVLPWIAGLGAVINVVGNIILVPAAGMMGAAFASLASFAAMAFALYRESQKVYPVQYDWLRVGMLWGIIGGAYAIERVLALSGAVAERGMEMLAIRTALAIAAITGLFLKFFSRGEVAFVKQLVGRVGGLSKTDAARSENEPVENSNENVG